MAKIYTNFDVIINKNKYELIALSDGYSLTGLCFLPFPDNRAAKRVDWVFNPDFNLFDKLRCELTEYGAGLRTNFTVSYALESGKFTDFQKKVWRALEEIPYGTTISYKNFAIKAGLNSNAVRAVANAIAANPIAIILACHRVIGSNGSLTGYAAGLDVKRSLLELEATRAVNY